MSEEEEFLFGEEDEKEI